MQPTGKDKHSQVAPRARNDEYRTCVTLPGLDVESPVLIVWMESTITSAGLGSMMSI